MTRKVLLIFSLFISSIVTAQTITVYFDFNSFTLNNETRNILNKFIASGKATSVAFFGHTDQMGSTEFNEWLSIQRALAVRDYLMSKGLKQNNISVLRGFGAERLITDQPDSASRRLNRRVTITNRYKPSPTDLAISSKQSAIYYTKRPDIIKKELQDTSTVSTALTAANIVTQKSSETKTAVTISDNVKINLQAKKEPVKKVEDTDAVLTPVQGTSQTQGVTSVENKQMQVKDSSIASTQKTTSLNTDNRKAVADPADQNNPDTARAETLSQTAPGKRFVIDSAEIKRQRVQQSTVAVKESFAEKLSKAVNDPSIAKTPAGANNKTAAASTNVPVVKQQKHEKLIEDIIDKSTKVGEHIVLRHIHFYGGRHAFLPQAYPALDDLLETMQKVPALQIEIQGHICCQEGEGDQIDFDSGEPVLSVTRAKAVYDFLVENGIDKSRMSYVGLAHKFPIIKEEANEEEATINRRVEIKILKK